MKFAAMIGVLTLLSGAVFWAKPAQNAPREEYVLLIEQRKTEPPAENNTVAVFDGTEVKTMPMEDYLPGVVLTEMPAVFPEEALKAQAVAARTYAALAREKAKHQDYDLCTDAGCCQAWRSQALLRQDFGNRYDELAEKGKNAVNSTAGEVLLYGGKLIDAVYFSCSGGSSEAAVAVWGTDVPYLQAVDSPGEEDADPFCTEKRISFAEFRSILKAAQPQTVFGIIPQDWVGTVEYTAGGGVASIYLGQCCFSGTEVRSLFSLPSTKFHLQVGNGEMIFTAYGYGHRVGMSQYGAKAMAEAGADYRQILQHYYTDVSIKKLPG